MHQPGEERSFDERLAAFRACDFTTRGQREDIEQLTEEYIGRPSLQTRARTRLLLWHLLSSEIAPTARIAATGLDPVGLIMSLSPRMGRWLVYAVFLALWALAFSQARNGSYVLVIVMALWSVAVGYRWWRCNSIIRDLNSQILRELRSEYFDPSTLRRRLWRIEGQGFRPHSNVYALFRIDAQLSAGRAPGSPGRAEAGRRTK
jgi:hypothetical protein